MPESLGWEQRFSLVSRSVVEQAVVVLLVIAAAAGCLPRGGLDELSRGSRGTG